VKGVGSVSPKDLKEIVIKPDKQKTFTIGRDDSNNLVLDDDRVSRSHARLDITPTEIQYVDLGSLKGSKVNGRPVIRSKLASGDVLVLGQTEITLELRKKGFSLFRFAKRSRDASKTQSTRGEASTPNDRLSVGGNRPAATSQG